MIDVTPYRHEYFGELSWYTSRFDYGIVIYIKAVQPIFGDMIIYLSYLYLALLEEQIQLFHIGLQLNKVNII